MRELLRRLSLARRVLAGKALVAPALGKPTLINAHGRRACRIRTKDGSVVVDQMEMTVRIEVGERSLLTRSGLVRGSATSALDPGDIVVLSLTGYGIVEVLHG